MIDWVHDIAKSWGRYMRRDMVASGFPSTSVMGRIREEGSVGAAIRSHIDEVNKGPRVSSMPADIREFHNAWEVLDQRPKYTLYVCYAAVGEGAAKADELGVSVPTMYRRRNSAHVEIWQEMERTVRTEVRLSKLSKVSLS